MSEFEKAFKHEVYFPKTKINYWTFRKLRSLKTKYVGTKGWDEFLKYLTRDIHLTPTIHEQVQQGTAVNLLEMWMSNFADNLSAIRFGDIFSMATPKEYRQLTIADLVSTPPLIEGEPDYKRLEGSIEKHKGVNVKFPPKGSAIIVGRGPSLFKHKHCEMLAESKYQGMVIASDGGLIPLIEAGVVPDFVVSVDGAPIIKKYFEHPRVREFGSKMKWICSVTVSHEVYETVKNIGMQTYWFNPIFDDWREHESWTRLQVLMTCSEKFQRGVPRLNSLGNSGACAWNFAMSILNRSPIGMIGVDFGYPEETKLEDTQYFSGILKIAKGDTAKIKDAYKKFYHPTFKTHAYVDFVFYHYRQAFLSVQQLTPFWYQLYGGTINATEGGTLFGQNIKCMSFADFLKEHPK